MKNFLILLCLSIPVSCTTSGKQMDDNTLKIPYEYQKTFQTSMNDLESGRYDEAIKGFESIIKKQKQGFIYYSALFNIGSAYQKLKKCEKSKETFSNLVSKINDESIFKVQGLLQLHYAYECLGDVQRALATLKDVDKRKEKLNEISQLVEIPARFSILYAQLEDDIQSLLFRDRAFDGIKKIKSPIKDPLILNQTAAQLFYIMGQSLVRENSIKIHQYLLAVPHHQIYLIQSYLLNDFTWSVQAERELNSLYQKLWITYKKLSVNHQSMYKNQIIQIISSLQKISRESHSSKLNKLSSSIVNKAVQRFKL